MSTCYAAPPAIPSPGRPARPAPPPTRLPHAHTPTHTNTGITYLTGTRVTSADVKQRTLTLQDGSSIGYEKLIVATGAKVGREGINCLWHCICMNGMVNAI